MPNTQRSKNVDGNRGQRTGNNPEAEEKGQRVVNGKRTEIWRH